VRHEQALSVGADLVDNSVILSQDKVKLRIVHLELVFLQKHDLCALRNVDSDSGEALGFTDESKDLAVKVHIELVVVGMSDYQSGLKSSLCLFYLVSPLLTPEILEGE